MPCSCELCVTSRSEWIYYYLVAAAAAGRLMLSIFAGSCNSAAVGIYWRKNRVVRAFRWVHLLWHGEMCSVKMIIFRTPGRFVRRHWCIAKIVSDGLTEMGCGAADWVGAIFMNLSRVKFMVRSAWCEIEPRWETSGLTPRVELWAYRWMNDILEGTDHDMFVGHTEVGSNLLYLHRIKIIHFQISRWTLCVSHSGGNLRLLGITKKYHRI